MSGAGARAAGWAAHLRGGGATPWADWDAVGASSDGVTEPLPGAQHLELLRRLNALGGPAPAGLVERVWRADAIGRGQPDLPLPGTGDRAFGPRPMDPAQVPARELLRVAVGLLADDLVAGGDAPDRAPVPTTAHRVVRRLTRRRHRLVGDPLAATALRRGLVAAGRPPVGAGGTPDRVVVLAAPLTIALGHAWMHAAFDTDAGGWPGWVRRWHRADRVPPWLDAPALAAEWSARLGGRRVHVVGDLATAAGLLGGPTTWQGPTAVAADLGRRLHPALGLRVPADLRRRLLRCRWWPLAEVTDGLPTLAVPARHAAWAAHHEARLRAALADGAARAGYAVHGDPLAPAPGSETVTPTPEAALDLALRCLIDGRLRKAA